MQYTYTRGVIMLLILTSLLACSSVDKLNEQLDSQETAEQTVDVIEKCIHIKGHKPCDFETFDVHGNIVNLHDLEGSPLILDISAAWCGPCRAAAQEVQDVQDAYSEYNLKYLTLLFEDTGGNVPNQSDLEVWASQNEITTAPVWGGSRDLLVNSPIETEQGFYMTSLPTFYFINSEMRIYSMQVGFNSSVIEEKIQEMLND